MTIIGTEIHQEIEEPEIWEMATGTAFSALPRRHTTMVIHAVVNGKLVIYTGRSANVHVVQRPATPQEIALAKEFEKRNTKAILG